MHTLEQDCVWRNGQASIFRKNFAPLAQSPAGPPTTTLSAALGSSATTCTVSSLPTGIARSGWAQISSSAGKETIRYSATSADGATWSLSRGLLNSTALNHPSGTKTVAFIEVEKQTFRSIRSKIVYDAPVYAMCGWSVGAGAETYMPQSPITIRDGVFEAHVSPSTFFGGEVIRHTAHCDLDVEGLRATHHGLVYGSTPILSSAIYLAGSNGAVANTGDAPPARIIGRNNVVSVAGKSDSNSSGFRTMTFENYGFWSMDFDLDTRLECNNVGILRAVNIGGTATTLAPQSRLGLKVSSTVGGGNPLGLRLGGTSFVTLQGPLSLDLDFSEMLFTPTSTDSTYQPWFIDATQLDRLIFNKVIHSPSATAKYAYRKPLSSVVTANYTVLPWTELVMVDTTSGPVTLTLPSTTVGGYSLLGEPLSRGWQLQIIDAGRNARNNPITITPASTDRISGGTAGASMQLDDNGQQVTLIAYPGLPGWLGSLTNNLDGTVTG